MNANIANGYDFDSPRNIPLDKKYHYARFVKQTIKRKVVPWKKVTVRECHFIYKSLLQYFAATSDSDEQFLLEKRRIDENWPIVRKKMRKCPGLANFMAEIGVHSRYFYPFLLDIPTGTAMLPAFFQCRDIFGKVVPIPSEDAMYQFCLNDPVFQSVRFRNRYEQQYLEKAKNPLALAGGTLPQLWFDDFEFDSEGQRLTVFDPDESLLPVLEQIFPEGLEACGIDYHFEGFEAATRSDEHLGQHDLVTAMGLGSYNINCLDKLLNDMISLTTHGGTILIDFQILCTALLFDKLVLCWETERPMKPSKNIAEIINLIFKICHRNGMAEVVEYQIAPENAGIVFRISKK